MATGIYVASIMGMSRGVSLVGIVGMARGVCEAITIGMTKGFDIAIIFRHSHRGLKSHYHGYGGGSM